jgi:hypothetical protein
VELTKRRHLLEREQVAGEQYHGHGHACGLGELGIIRMRDELMYFSPSSSRHTPGSSGFLGVGSPGSNEPSLLMYTHRSMRSLMFLVFS